MGKYNKLFISSIVVTIIGVLILIFSLFIFGALISSQAKSSAILAKDNVDLWGQVPGKSKVTIYRDQYFYVISNMADVILGKSKPVAKEIGPFRHTEAQNFTNPVFESNDTVVKYNLYKSYGKANDSVNDLNTNISILNLVS